MRNLYLMIIFSAWAGWGQNLQAQAQPNPGQALEQQKRLQEQELTPPSPNTIPTPAQAPAPAASAQAGPKFYIATITVEGAEQLNPKRLRSILSKYEKTNFSKGTIDLLIGELTNAYIDQGLITSRVYIPPQNIAAQHLRLVAVEGKIEQLTVNNNHWPDQVKSFMAFPTEAGQTLQLRDLEQGLDQINRVSSGRATLQLQPGDQAGQTKVLVKNQPQEEYRFSGTYDNYGQTITGRERLTFDLGLDNVFNLNENINSYYLGSYNSNALGTAITLPYQWWTFNLGASYSEYVVPVQEGVDIFGSTYDLNTGLSQVVFRDARHKVSVGASLDVKNSGRVLNDVVLTPQPLTVVTLDVNDTYRPNDAIWTFDFNYERGLDALGAGTDASGLANELPHSQFDRLQATVSVTKALLPWLQLKSFAQGQYGLEGLYPSEQLFLGDNYTVRGFRDDNALGDDGFFVRNECQFSIPAVTKIDWLDWALTRCQPYVFADGGYTSLKSANQGVDLEGVGAGLRLNWNYFSADASWATPIHEGGGLNHENNVFYLSATATLF